MKKVYKPTTAELEILAVIWELEAATVREIFEVIGARKPTIYTTVLKTLQIMDEKGFVERDKTNRAHVYRAKLKQSDTSKQMLQDVLHKIFGGSALKLVQQVLETEMTSADEMKKIRRMIKEAEKQTLKQAVKKENKK